MAESPPDVAALDPDDLKRLVLQLLEAVAGLKAENAALREEIARLKGLKGPPKLQAEWDGEGECGQAGGRGR